MATHSAKFLRIHPTDNAVVALQDLEDGEEVELDAGDRFRLNDAIPAKHKFASCDLNENDVVTMYGVTVGKTTCPVPRGGRITTENLSNAVAPAVLRTDPCAKLEPTERYPMGRKHVSMVTIGRTAPSAPRIYG